jgi:DNA-binding transcriptional LysR family regulator
MTVGTPTVDQIWVFLSVVEAGGFAAAARTLKRAPSVVSYAISNLETQLGLALFTRSPTKRPRLTDAGRLIYAEARSVRRAMDGLKASAARILEGFEAEISLAVDVLFPSPRLMTALIAFQAEFPNILLRLSVEALGGVSQRLIKRSATLGITGPLALHTDVLGYTSIGGVELITVAASDHPLASQKDLQATSTRDHTQIVLTDRSKLTEGQDFQVTSDRTWRVADLSTKHALLLSGLGWGNMPAPMVAKDIDEGRLVRLIVPQMGGTYGFRVAHRLDTPPGPAASWLVKYLESDEQSTELLDHSI